MKHGLSVINLHIKCVFNINADAAHCYFSQLSIKLKYVSPNIEILDKVSIHCIVEYQLDVIFIDGITSMLN